jgi:2-oxoisovalerate dehydrogenase E1 component beta subunit
MTVESMSMAKAINSGLRRAMIENSKVIMMGEDIGLLGGVFRVTEGLLAEFGDHRVLDTPLTHRPIAAHGKAGV